MTAMEPRTQNAAAAVGRRRQLILAAAVIAAGCLAAILLYATRPVLQPQQSARPLLAVRAVEAVPVDVPLTVQSQGAVEPHTEAELIPEVSGRVVWISPSLRSGGRFTAGELLLRIDDSDYRNGVGSAEAALMRTQAEAEFARFESERMATLLARDLASRSQAENALRARRVAESGLKEAQVALERARLDLARTGIRVPFTGRVRSARVDIGQTVNRGDKLATVYATDYMEIRLPIADRQLAFLDPALLRSGSASGDAVPVRLHAQFGGQRWSWEGRIVRTEGEIDAGSRMVHVVARVENPDAADQAPLPVGLFVQAEIRGQIARGVIELPRAAMRDGDRVLVVDAEDRLRFRPVTLLRADRDTVLVSAGLQAGERVCISPLQLVVDGMRVAPVAGDAGAES
jgi:RND family efflux transporter MFP subunit